MAIWDLPVEIGILLYPGASGAMVHGLTDMFTVASSLARQAIGANAPMLRVSHWQANEARDGVVCVSDSHPALEHRPVVAIVPGSWTGEPDEAVKACLVQWLVERHRGGATLCSVCGGAFVLAGTGLMTGRAMTTHWDYLGKLAERFPDIRIDETSITVEDGNFITAGGVLAWTDLGLKLVDRHLGSAIMLETARYMLVDPPGREQRYYSNFAPRTDHGDAAVLKVQNWLQSHAAAQPAIAAMAKVAGLEERTFLRRFVKATGLKPTDYCQRLRVGKARAMLEQTRQSVDHIGHTIGYEDPASFRRVFQRVVGMSPSDYRRRFSVARTAGQAPAHSVSA